MSTDFHSLAQAVKQSLQSSGDCNSPLRRDPFQDAQDDIKVAGHDD
jgi:hypothetical protein